MITGFLAWHSPECRSWCDLKEKIAEN